ncbi:MAG: undecaprenyl-phosphate glucose phosphotransferase [Burkholderiales bacterium]|jgi:putative colanic acid biosynthesis UDP-glucose lipid carrier transferase
MPNGGLSREFGSLLGVLHRAVDAALIFLALYFFMRLYGAVWSYPYILAVSWAVVLFLLVTEFRQLYSSWRTSTLREELKHVFVICVVVQLGLIALAFMTKTSEQYSRILVGSWFLMMPLLLGVERAIMRGFLWVARSRGYNSRTAAIAGLTPAGVELKRNIELEPRMGLRLSGFYDSRGARRMREDTQLAKEQLRGSWDNLIRDVQAGRIDYVYIALPLSAKARIVEIVNALADTTASVFVVPDLFVSDLAHGRWGELGTVPVVSVYDSPFLGVDGWLKRAEDLVLGSVFLAIAALPMLLIAMAIKITSRGPVIFRQRRYGLNGNVVEVLKFRTMKVCEDGDRVPQAKVRDARVTRLGVFLRKTSLDELPQFFNVLGGEMSIVGPRPHAVAHNEQYRRLIHGYMLRHKVKPGITGWAQINGWRGETDTLDKMQMRVEHDLEYVRNWSLLLDLKIIALTIYRGFVGKNVY